ncbi:MAG: MFS transporter [Pseudomonadota bacterium]
MTSDHTKGKNGIGYGWYILGASFLILFFNSGARYSFGIMIKPMIQELGWSRSSLSLAFSLNMMVFALSVTVVGRVYDRYGPKWVIIISTLFLSSGYVVISFLESLWQFVLFYGLVSAVGLGGTSLSFFAAVMSKWFEKRRGLAISSALSGSCLGHFALVPLFTLFVLHFGWRASYLWIGLIMLVLNVSLALWVIKGDPNERGSRTLEKTKGQGAHDAEEKWVLSGAADDFGFREAMRTSSYWLFILVNFVCGCGDFLVTTHLIPFVTDHGFSPTTAGNMLGWVGFFSLIGILVAGPVSDLIGTRIPLAGTFAIRVLLFLLILNSQDLVSLYIFALGFGFTFLIGAPLAPVLLGRMYGFSHIGVLSGFATTIHHMGGSLGAYMGGVVFDRTGSYRAAFILSALMALVAVVSALMIREKRYVRPV